MCLKLWKREIQECQIKLALNMFGCHEGLTLTRFLCFAKFIFTQGIFEDPLLLVCNTLPLLYCFPSILTECLLFIVKGVWFCPIQPLKMKVVCSWRTVGWWAAESENYNSVSCCCAGRSCNSIRYWELRFGSETFMVGHQNTQRKGKGIEEWRELRF